MRFRQPRGAAVAAVAVALTAAVLAPVLLHRGFVLVYDMVFVPRQPLLPASIGLGPALPRAVPADAVIALISTVLPGDVLQKLVLVGSLLAAAVGAARLVPTDRAVIRVIAAVGYTWNAYVAERLFIGHWPVLLAYGALPWIFGAGLAVRRGEPRSWPRLVLWMVPAVLGPTGGLLATGAAVAAVGRRHAAPALGVALLLNAPWWLPSMLRPSSAVSDPAAVAAFAARGENWGGAVLSVLGLGGIWNAEVVPPSRGSPIVPVVTVLVAALALYGMRVLARDPRGHPAPRGSRGDPAAQGPRGHPAPRGWGAAPARALLLLGALGLLIAVAGSVPPLDDGLRWAVANVPGAGLLRDGQRWAAWWALPLAIGAALGAEELAGRLPDALGRGAVLVGAVLLPFAVLPDLAWGGLGRLNAVRYPSDWPAAAAVISAEPEPGDVLVLPFMTYRSFAWNDHRTQLDPAPRLVPASTVTDDALPVGESVVGGEDPRVAAVRRALADGTPLDALGVRWVLVEHGTPGALPAQLSGLTPRYDGEWVSVYRLDPTAPAVPAATSAAPAPPVLIADGLALVLAGGALLWLLLPGRRSWRARLWSHARTDRVRVSRKIR